ncbi:MAG TPA: ubiquinol-cytochrome c reductase iron-sulfur subunit [Terriglobales bacterium]|nr:ubiquinol-cytochrome c reductase iron-sulfur subunit [Terriglobales bacterium]
MSDVATTSEAVKPEESVRAEIGRRDFFNAMAAGAFGIAGLGAVVVTYGYLLPNALFEPSMSFRAGAPDLYPLDSVTYIQDQQVYIVRTGEGFYAVSAICTHLGCNTQWKPEVNLIACPCHGSKFKSDGTKVEGPAPRSLPHFPITLTPDGELLVDKLETIKAGQALKV